MAQQKNEEYTIDGRKWWHATHNLILNNNQWLSDYWCSDGDGVILWIEKEESGFELLCFSGIGASGINVDSIDFSAFQSKCPLLDHRDPFEKQCCVIADYFCRLFCEYKETKDYDRDKKQ